MEVDPEEVVVQMFRRIRRLLKEEPLFFSLTKMILLNLSCQRPVYILRYFYLASPPEPVISLLCILILIRQDLSKRQLFMLFGMLLR